MGLDVCVLGGGGNQGQVWLEDSKVGLQCFECFVTLANSGAWATAQGCCEDEQLTRGKICMHPWGKPWTGMQLTA